MPDRKFRAAPPSRLDVLGSIAVALLVRWLWPDAHGYDHVTVAFWGILFSLIGQALGWLGQQAITLAVTAAQVAVWIGQAAWHIIRATGLAFGRVTDFLGRFWSHVLEPFVKAVWSDLQTAYRWVKRWADRAISAIEKVRARVMAIYERWFRPVFDAIEATRRTMQLLAALHVPFAREIERRLAELEDRLLWPIRQIMLRLNQAIDWIDRIITFDGYLQRITLIASLWKHAQESWTVLLHPQLADVDPARTAAIRAVDYKALTADDFHARISDYQRAGAGELAPLADAVYQQLTSESVR